MFQNDNNRVTTMKDKTKSYCSVLNTLETWQSVTVDTLCCSTKMEPSQTSFELQLAQQVVLPPLIYRAQR